MSSVDIPRGTFGICANYKGCRRFEYVVPAFEGDTCEECGEALLHESGLTWADAREKGYRSAFKVTVLPEAKPPEKRSAKTRFHYGEVGKPGEVGGFLPSREQRSKRKTKRRKR